VLHRTWIGRQIYAVGQNQSAARYAGVRAARLKIGLFVFSGTVAALAGVILTSRLSSARADAGQGMTLAAVTAVLLGGVDIFGGSGTLPGVVLAVFTLAVLQNSLRLADVSTQLQSIAVGLLLIVSVVLPKIVRKVGGVFQSRGVQNA
jgi:rhamnose transport system permease protein